MRIEEYKEATQKLKDFYDWSIVERGDRGHLNGPWEPIIYELIKIQNNLRKAKGKVKEVLLNMDIDEKHVRLELDDSGNIEIMINSAGGFA